MTALPLRRVPKPRDAEWAAFRESGLDQASTTWNRLPAGIALPHIGVIACRIGAVIPGLGGVRLAIVVIVVVRIIAPPRICKRSTEEKSPIVKSIAVEPAPVKPTPVKPAKSGMESAAMEAAKSASVETAASATAMRPGIGGIWLTERGNAQESSCGCQSSCHPWPGSMFA